MNAKGEILQARKDGEEQAAQKGYNLNSISICMDLDGDHEYPTIEQIVSLKKFLREKLTEYKLTWDDVKFHRDVAVKTCPGGLVTRNYLVTEMLKS
jgi:N-acetylmuramoyl-L-alanine amidase CwlA